MSANQAQITQWLSAGVDAYHAGQLNKAQNLLMQVITADEHSEEGWLWLSHVVDDREEQRICLENVLTINPHNQEAQRILATLTNPEGPPPPTPIDFETFPGGPPLAPPPIPTHESWVYDSQSSPSDPQLSYQQDSSFDDVWSSSDPICAYCAQVINENKDVKCPNCQHQLVYYKYLYPRRSITLLGYIFFSLFAAFLFFAQTYTFDTEMPLFQKILYFFLSGTLATTLFGSIMRFFRIHLITLAINMIIFFITLSASIEPIGQTYHIILDLVRAELNSFVMVLSFTSIILGVGFTGSDFAQEKIIHTAKLDKKVNSPHHFYRTGRDYARRGMWATAILHYQRAVGTAPLQANYQRALGEAYARLRFYDRSLDILQSAHQNASNPDVRAELTKIIDYVTTKVAEKQT
ncbi:MAG TPA: hypothetical protein VLL52_02020 [Anaerolineae bacterium]|nr:hypothetical protein [Anaerolineae bacterium]